MPSAGPAGAYETLAGRAYGELDPNDPHNAIITDIHLAPRNSNGKVEYMATFYLVKPIDMTKSSHLMWQYVPNRGAKSASFRFTILRERLGASRVRSLNLGSPLARP